MPVSTITNTISNPSGTVVGSVPVVARLKPGTGFRTSDGTEISAQVSTTSNGSGVWSLALERQSNIVPAGTWWEIEEQIPATNGGSRVWAISVGAADATLQASLTTPSLDTTLSNYLTQAAADARYAAINVIAGLVSVTNVKDFGAVGDGVTDDAAAVRAAIRSAAAAGRFVYFPKGIYLIDADGILSDINQVGLSGMTFLGAHYNASQIKLKTNGSTRYLYHNGATNRLTEAYFLNLGFTSDSLTYGNGFYLTGGVESGFHFDHCAFFTLNQPWIIDGTAGCDNHRFYGCLWTNIAGAVYTINNAQAVIHEFYGCQVHSNGADIFVTGANGGGEVHWYGGEIIVGSGASADCWILNLQASSGLGPSNCKFVFHSLKPELHSVHAKLVKAPTSGPTGVAEIVFEDSNFDTTEGGTREAVTIGPMRQVLFRRCRLPTTDTFTYEITGLGTAANIAHHGEIGFEECTIPTDLSRNATLAASLGRVWADGRCYLNPATVTTREATAFDFNWENTAKGTGGPPIKTAVIKFAAEVWPETGGDERMVRLPAQCWIKAWHIYKPAQGTNNNNIVFNLGNNDKSVIYASSAAAAQKTLIQYDVDNLWINTTRADNVQNVRMWATGAGATDGTITGGFAYIEYV